MALKFQFFNVQLHQDIEDNFRKRHSILTLDNTIDIKPQINDPLNNLTIISASSFNRQLFMLVTKHKQENDLIFSSKLDSQKGLNSKSQSFEYIIVKVSNNKIIDEYFLFNRIIYSFKIVKMPTVKSGGLLDEQSLATSDKVYMLACGSDFIENRNIKEEKKELNILSSIYIIDATELVDPFNRLLSNKGNIDNLILKKISLVNSPNTNFLYTERILPSSYTSQDDITGMACNSEFNIIALGLLNGNIIFVYPSDFPLNYDPSKNAIDPKAMNKTLDKSKISKLSIFSTDSKLTPAKTATQEVKGLPTVGPKRNEITVTFDSKNLLNTRSISAIKMGDILEDYAINSLEFTTIKSKKGEYLVLYISTINSLYYYLIDNTLFRINFQILNPSIGTYQNSLLLTNKTQMLVCSKENFVQEYINLEKGATWFFEGKVHNPVVVKNYIAFIYYETTTPILAVYDLKNKIFAYYNNLYYKIHSITVDLQDQSFTVVIENQHKLIQIISLIEKDNSYKFQVFYNKRLYDFAFDYARNIKYNLSQIAEIHKNYGDYLYDISEFNKAVSEYVTTIGFVHPSFIISKFLDNSKIEYLIAYLESLHASVEFKKKFPDEITSYTKLLLNLYVKQKNFQSLSSFIKNVSFENMNKKEIEDLIETCQELKEVDLALSIARRLKSHDKILDILTNYKCKSL